MEETGRQVVDNSQSEESLQQKEEEEEEEEEVQRTEEPMEEAESGDAPCASSGQEAEVQASDLQ